jgi:hypothetical protein
MRSSIGAALAASLLLAPSMARAQQAAATTAADAMAHAQEAPADVAKDSGLFRARVGVEVAAAHFRLDQGSGQYLVTTAIADITLRERLSVRAVVPMDVLARDGAAPHVGIGDVQLRMKVRLFESNDWLVQASLGAQFPTGDTHFGLGNGAPSLAPLVTAGYEVGRCIVFLTVSDTFSLRPYGPPPVNFVDPSTDQEIVATLGANLRIKRGLFARLLLTPIVPLLAADRSHPFLSTTPLLGFSDPRLQIMAGVALPLAGTFRFDERAVVNVLFYL